MVKFNQNYNHFTLLHYRNVLNTHTPLECPLQGMQVRATQYSTRRGSWGTAHKSGTGASGDCRTVKWTRFPLEQACYGS